MKKWLPALMLLIASANAMAQSNDKYVLKNAFVFTGDMKDDFTKRDVYIANGKIVWVVPNGAMAVDTFANAKVYDMTGKYIVPGLIDAHVHLRGDNNSYENFQRKVYPTLQKELYNGVTSVRDLGGDGLILAMASRSVEKGEMPSPDIFFSAFMAGKKYYNRYNRRPDTFKEYVAEENTPWRQTIEDNTNVVEAIIRAKACGATGIKLYNAISKKMVAKLCKEAHRQNMQVWGHASIIPALPMDFIKANVNVMSHIDLLFYQQFESSNTSHIEFDYETQKKIKTDFPGLEPMLKAIKDKDIIIDATYFLMAMNQDKAPLIVLMKKLREAGVKVSIGTDWMFDDEKNEANIHREMKELITDCGYTPKEVIHAATVIGAQTLGATDRGKIEKGKKADLLVVNANPFENIDNLKQIDRVIKTGKMHPIPTKK